MRAFGWVALRRASAVLAILCALNAQSASPQASVTYTYDTLGRVVIATYSDGTSVTYQYDAAGNRTSTITSSNGCPLWGQFVWGAVNWCLGLTANPVSLSVAENSSNNNVSLNITGGTATSVAVTAQAAHGTATASGTTISYTPAAGYSGSDTFQYDATNAKGTSLSATVSVTVVAPPIANGVSVTVAKNSSGNNVPLNITGGTPTNVSVTAQPSHGSAAASGTSITYTPTAGYSGSDSFTYNASNLGGTSSSATVSVSVVVAPIANNIGGTVQENSSNNPITLNITGGAATSVSVSTQAAHGTAVASGTSINYTPTSGYIGSDSFAYTATNVAGTSSPATASLTVAFASVTDTFTWGAGTETVPTGATSVTITMWSGGAAGGHDVGNGGGGGGGGCQAVQTIAVAGGNSFSFSVGGTAAGRSTDGIGQSGTASSVSGTVAGGSVNLHTNAVAGGGSISNIGGAGATCSGGTDTAGQAGGAVDGGNGGGTGGGVGGSSGLGSSGAAPGGGGAGALGGTSGTGAAGEVIFSYH